MKRFLIFITILLIALLIPFNAFCEELDGNRYSEIVNSFDMSAFEELDESTYSFLNSVGFLDFDYEQLINLSFDDIKNEVFEIIKGSAKAPLKAMLSVLVFVLLSSFFKSIKISIEDDELSGLFSTISALVIAIALIMEMKGTIALACSTISICSDFMYAFVPAFCVIVAASGSAVSAFSTNTLLLTLAQALNYISKNIFIPLSNSLLAVGLCSSLRSELNLGSIIAFMKKYITTAISVLSAGFVSILSIKTAVSARADVLGLRSIRFAINSVVPVIGGAISEGLLSIQAYSSIIRSSVGAVGIVAVIFVFLPAISEVAIWRLFLNMSATLAETFSDSCVTGVLKAFCDSLLIMNIVLILSMVTTIISLGILIAARGAV